MRSDPARRREMTKQSLGDWLCFLENLHPDAIDLGLDRVATVAAALQLLPVTVPVVTVAGTNGKGSTVAVMEAVLNSAGYRVGAYTSPHLLRFNERIRVAAQAVDDGAIIDAFGAIDHARGDVSLTYFEFATLAALYVFQRDAVEVVLLEVGLGGRLDAVNIVDPSVAVITSIALDHSHWLGDTLAAIAREKAGIMRADTAVVIADTSVTDVLRDCARQVGAQPVLRYGVDFELRQEPEVTAGATVMGQLTINAGNAAEQKVSLQVQRALLPENIAAGLQAVALLPLDCGPSDWGRALQRLTLSGRREALLVAGLRYVLDVAHNPAAVEKLLEYLSITYCNGRTIGLFSAMADKDIGQMVALAAPAIDAWYLADQATNSRAASAQDIAEHVRECTQNTIHISPSLPQALAEAQSDMTKNDRLVVFGSFYTVAGVLPSLQACMQSERPAKDAENEPGCEAM